MTLLFFVVGRREGGRLDVNVRRLFVRGSGASLETRRWMVSFLRCFPPPHADPIWTLDPDSNAGRMLSAKGRLDWRCQMPRWERGLHHSREPGV